MNLRIKNHNREIRESAEYRADEMRHWPSPLEERMEEFLVSNWIDFEPQKIFYIYDKDGWIVRYYIADFYVPKAKIIIEVDGKFHNKQKQHDKDRTKTIQKNYPGVEVLRYNWKDLSDECKMKDLLHRISTGSIFHR